MNNLMNEYIEFTKKNLKKYMKIIFEKYYDNIVIEEYIKTLKYLAIIQGRRFKVPSRFTLWKFIKLSFFTSRLTNI